MSAALKIKNDDAKAFEEENEEHIADQQRIALHHLSAVFDETMELGIAPDAVAHAGIFQSLVIMVQIYGEDAVAGLLKQIITAVHEGRYTTETITH